MPSCCAPKSNTKCENDSLQCQTSFMLGRLNQSMNICGGLYQQKHLVGLRLVPSETCLPSIFHHLKNENISGIFLKEIKKKDHQE